jgi:hypothetical protein
MPAEKYRASRTALQNLASRDSAQYKLLQTYVIDIKASDPDWNSSGRRKTPVVVKTSSRRQRNLLIKHLLDQLIAPDASVQMPGAFWKRGLPENSLKFFFAKIMT